MVIMERQEVTDDCSRDVGRQKKCGTIEMELLDKHDDIDVFKRRWKEVEMREE